MEPSPPSNDSTHARSFFEKYGGKPFPKVMIDEASKELDGLVKVLENEGVKVRRPDITCVDFSKEYETPWWKSKRTICSNASRHHHGYW